MTLIQWQTISLISKITAILMGLVSNIIVLRILSPEDWGIIGLAMSVVGTVGVLQHLGLATGLNREIAKEKEPRHIPTIIYTALLTRLPLSLILAAAIFIIAPLIASRFYDNPTLIVPLQLLGVLIIIEGVQDIFSSSVGALKLFRGLFVFQVVLATINFAANVIGVTYFGMNGYFYAKYVYMGSSLIAFGAILLRHFYKQSVPVWSLQVSRVHNYIKGLLGIGSAAFGQKLLNIYWQRIPTIVMGSLFPASLIGIFNFADFFTQRLMIFADAATDVSVPVFLRTYQENFEQFKKEFRENFLRIAIITMLFGVFGTLFLPEFLTITGLNKYEGVQPVFLVTAIGYTFFSLVNGLSVIFVAANARRHMLVSYLVMFMTTLLTISALAQWWGIIGGGLAFSMGAAAGLVYYIVVTYRQFNVPVLLLTDVYLFLPITLLLIVQGTVLTKIIGSVIVMLVYLWLIRRNDPHIWQQFLQKFKKLFHKIRL